MLEYIAVIVGLMMIKTNRAAQTCSDIAPHRGAFNFARHTARLAPPGFARPDQFYGIAL